MPSERTNQYDDNQDSYRTYWQGRAYEHDAEVSAVRTLLGQRRFADAVDVGGGYGRMVPVLQEFADRVTLMDASTKQLADAEEFLADRGQVTTRLMREGHLELDANSVDLVTMIRVMHHLPDPVPMFTEIARVLRPEGLAVIECANLAHAGNRLRYAVRGRGIPLTPVDRRSAANRERDSIPFVNHHPGVVVRQLASTGLLVQRSLSVSNLRSPALKRLLPPRVLLRIEEALQRPLAAVRFGPSIFFLAGRT